MAGAPGTGQLTPFEVAQNNIENALNNQKIYIMMPHNRPHFSGGDPDRSVVNANVDPIKVVAGIIKFFENTFYKFETIRIYSIEYEAEFDAAIGKLFDTPGSATGHFLRIRVRTKF